MITSAQDTSLDTNEWLEPWMPIEDSDRALAGELKSEVPPGHQLFGVAVDALAARIDCDDVLYRLTPSHRLAVVHLTYSRESSPDWPETELFDTFDDFRSRRMVPDHHEYWQREEVSPDWYSRAVRPRP
jgi:hypothetical protein